MNPDPQPPDMFQDLPAEDDVVGSEMPRIQPPGLRRPQSIKPGVS